MLKDLVAEKAALSSALADITILRQLEEEDFTDFKRYFKAIRDSVEPKGINLGKVSDRLLNYTWLSELIGIEYIGANYQILQRLREVRARREAQAFKVTGSDPTAYPTQFAEKSKQIHQLVMPARKEREEIIEKIEKGTPVLPTGYEKIDWLCNGGLEEGGIFVIAARPGIGKTTLALNIMRNLIEQEKDVYFGSLEMSDNQIYTRLLQCFWGKNVHDVRKHVRDMYDLPSQVVVSNPSSNIDRLLADMIANLECKLFIIDYFQLIQISSRENRVGQLESISSKLKDFAMEYKKPILLLSQLNRDIEKRTSKEPELSDLRGCGSLEQDATVVSFLYRPSETVELNPVDELMYGKNLDEAIADGRIIWTIKKSRNGMLGQMELDFQPNIMRFLPSAI